MRPPGTCRTSWDDRRLIPSNRKLLNAPAPNREKPILGPIDSDVIRGFDTGQKVNRRKRDSAADLRVYFADIQDRTVRRMSRKLFSNASRDYGISFQMWLSYSAIKSD